MKITKANAVYTGGNIWLFYGELEDGNFFLTDDNGCTEILDTDPSDLDESLYYEWQQEHLVKELDDESKRIDFCNNLCDKLIEDGDKGGMTDDEIEHYRKFFAEPL